MRVLNLVTNIDANCFRNQVDRLEALGVVTTDLTPSGSHEVVGETVTSRSPADYLRFVPTVLGHSFGPYDVLHANYGLTGPAAVAQPRLPVVLSLWGSDLLGKYGWLSKRCARHVDAVIVMSDAMADELDVHAHVIPHGVDLDRFEPAPRRAARADLDWSHESAHVLFPYPPSRDVKDYPRAERVVVAARDRLDGPVELHTLTDVPHERMPVYMNASDALLMTSKHEGSPNTVKEAMACNIPVVSTDVGDVRERLDGVEPSCVCRTDEAFVDALVDVIERDDRSNGRAAIASLSTERTAERILDVYESVV